jgi:hypothetical protein
VLASVQSVTFCLLVSLCDAVIDTKVISRAAGSAYVELGDTKVMAAV